jgi:Amt family ammonium transporter
MEMKMKNLVKWLRGGDGGPALPKAKGAIRKSVVSAGLAMMAMMVLMQAISWAQEKKEEPKPTAAPAAAAAATGMSKDQAKPAEKVDWGKKKDEMLATPKCMMDTMWTLLTGMLVFFMNLGFATVESGMCRVKNAVNILSKNFIVFAASAVAYWFLGWGLMFGDGKIFVSSLESVVRIRTGEKGEAAV